MGIMFSKVDHAEKVARCKARKRFMKLAVESRHQFAASHSAYMQALKNVGAAFRQFGDTELREPAVDTDNSSPPGTPDNQLFLPPPSPSKALRKLELADEDVGEKPTKNSRKGASNAGPPLPLESAPPPPPPPKSSSWGFLDPFEENDVAAEVAVAEEEAKISARKKNPEKLWFPVSEKDSSEQENGHGALVVTESVAIVVRKPGRKELVEVLRELDELFLKAYQLGNEVGGILEARKIHYHSNFVENRGFDSHTSKVLSAISWANWKSPLRKKNEETAIVAADEDHKGHSGTLDRLRAWEKKLYEEMRSAESHRLEYEKKCALLRNQDSRGDYNESIDKTRHLIKQIQTKIAVALEGVETAVAAILKIRDAELYPQLLELQEGLAKMWVELSSVHEKQCAIVSKIRPLDNLLGSIEATSNIHRLATSQLEAALDNWYSCLNKLVTSQRDYMRNLSGWVRLCVMPFEDMSATSSPPASALPPIHDLCLEWHQALDRLPDKVALEAVKSFVAVIHKIVELQNTELQHRRKVESIAKELNKKLTYIHNYEKKHPEAAMDNGPGRVSHRRSGDEDDDDEIHDILPPKSPLADRRAGVEVLKRKLEEEREQVAKAVYDTRAMTLNSLHTGLPSVFQSVSGFSTVCSQAFQLLYCNAHSNKDGSFSP